MRLVWIGRFNQPSGYGYVSRSMGQIQNLIAIDSESGKVVKGDSEVIVGRKTKHFHYTLRDSEEKTIVVHHDRPDNFYRLQVSGNALSVGNTIFESSPLPSKWPEMAASKDMIFCPTEFTSGIFEKEGVKTKLLEYVLAKDDNFYREQLHRRQEETGRRLGEKREYLHLVSVVSFLSRRSFTEISSSLRSYALNSGTSIHLSVKINARDQKELVNQLPEQIGGFFEYNLISEQMTDHEVTDFISSGDAYLSFDNMPGFDLPLMEAIAMGMPSLSLDYIGSSHLIPKKNKNMHLRLPLDGSKFLSNNTKSLYKAVEISTISTENIQIKVSEWIDGIVHIDPSLREKSTTHILESYSNSMVSQLPMRLEQICSDLPVESRDRVSILLHPTTKLAAVKGRRLKKFPETTKVVAALRGVANLVERLRNEKQVVAKGLALRLAMRFGDFLSLKFSNTDNNIEIAKIAANLPAPLTLRNYEKEKLKGLKNSRSGRVVILGNGPSLNSIDLNKLANEDVFACNKFYLAYPKIHWRPKFYIFMDWRLGADLAPSLNFISSEQLFLPTRLRPFLKAKDRKRVTWFTTSIVGQRLESQFGQELEKGIPSKGTVLHTAIQIAAYLGYTEIVLLGVDGKYTVPDSVIQTGEDKFGTGTKLNLTSTADDDPNHFHPEYFGKGSRWHDPNVEGMKRVFFLLSKAQKFRSVRILNATPDSEISVFEKVSFQDLWGK